MAVNVLILVLMRNSIFLPIATTQRIGLKSYFCG